MWALKNLLISQCLIDCRTINLNKCKDKAHSLSTGKSIQVNSHYVRFIRFFKMKNIEQFILGIQNLLLDISKIDLTYIIGKKSKYIVLKYKLIWHYILFAFR